MTLRQKQPVISDVFDQTSARFHQPLLQTGDCATLPDLLRTDQPEGGILGKLLGIVDAFVPCQAALHRLPQQVSKGQRGVLPPRIRQVLLDEFAESQAFVQLAH
jgi:hypothetical protein